MMEFFTKALATAVMTVVTFFTTIESPTAKAEVIANVKPKIEMIGPLPIKQTRIGLSQSEISILVDHTQPVWMMTDTQN